MKLSSYFVLFLGLLTLQIAYGDDHLKKEFGKRLGASIENSGIEFFQTAIRAVHKFYDTLLKEASPTTSQIADISQSKIELNEFSRKLKNGITNPEKFIQLVRQFVDSKYITLLKHVKQTVDSYNDNQKPIVLRAVTEAAQIMDESSKSFAMSIYDKWTELYNSTPKSELDKYPEYQQINEMMQGVAKTKGRGSVFLDVIRAMIIFFDVQDWKFILDLGEYDPNSNIA